MKPQPLKTKKPLIIRAANIPGSDVGKERYDLYANAYRQITKARAKGFYIECIAICASIIEDRLESRRQCLNPEDIYKRRFTNLGKLMEMLPKEERSNDKEIRPLYKKIAKWSEKRNEAIHQMVKYGEEKHKHKWTIRYRDLKKTINSGIKLARAISKKVKALNDVDYNRRLVNAVRS